MKSGYIVVQQCYFEKQRYVKKIQGPPTNLKSYIHNYAVQTLLSSFRPVLRIQNVYPGSKKSNKREGGKCVDLPFFVATNNTKLKIWVGIQDPEKTHPGSRIQGSKRRRIVDSDLGSATLNVKCIVQPFELGGETRLILSYVKK
jgi:hypothetical protein